MSRSSPAARVVSRATRVLRSTDVSPLVRPPGVARFIEYNGGLKVRLFPPDRHRARPGCPAVVVPEGPVDCTHKGLESARQGPVHEGALVIPAEFDSCGELG
jgi:hypothetical protein